MLPSQRSGEDDKNTGLKVTFLLPSVFQAASVRVAAGCFMGLRCPSLRRMGGGLRSPDLQQVNELTGSRRSAGDKRSLFGSLTASLVCKTAH